VGKMKKTEVIEPDCCGNCAFGQDTETKRYDKAIIACRRFPPQQPGIQQSQDPYPFPMVVSSQWCGEHKRRKDNYVKEE